MVHDDSPFLFLLSKAVDLNEASLDEWTVLHNAGSTWRNKREWALSAAQRLIAHGANVNAKEEMQRTPPFFAVYDEDAQPTALQRT
jgi:hypothetical protein